MLCTACGKDLHPVIEGDQSGRFIYTCANAECHAVLGPVRPSDASPSLVVGAPPSAKVEGFAFGGVIAPENLVEKMETRVAQLDVEIARLESLKEERGHLKRMLAVRYRVKRARNVIALPKKAATK